MQILECFSSVQQSALLSFFTACERAPRLGFEHMDPPMTMLQDGSNDAPDELLNWPSAAVCGNCLRLPPYKSVQLLKSRLLASMKYGGGFYQR